MEINILKIEHFEVGATAATALVGLGTVMWINIKSKKKRLAVRGKRK